jgi:dUTP pyrophosphatase
MNISFISPYALTRATDGSAGYDLHTTESAILYPGHSHNFSTGLHLAIPEGYMGIVKSRSGMSFKNSIEVGAGVIDSDYRGEVKIHLYNYGELRVAINAGERIAQLLIIKHETPEFIQVDSLIQTDRAANGFGSSGV